MKKLVLFLFVFISLWPHVASATVDSLVISQVQITGGSGQTTSDFVEIFNPTSTDIDLNGMRLVKRTQSGTEDILMKSWTESAIVPANGYYLWANSNFTTITVPADVTTSGTLADNNGIALRHGPNDTGTVIDSVAWGSAANVFVEGSVFATNPGAGEVLMRTEGADTDNNSVDFTIGSANPRNSTFAPGPIPAPTPSPTPTPDPTPTPTPTPAPSGGGPAYSSAVLISEFLPNPDGSDSGEEWIELFNNSAAAVNLGGWKLDDESASGSVGSSAYTIPADTYINAMSYLALDLPEGSFALDNTGGDTLRLLWPNNQLAHQVIYTGNAKEDQAYARKSESVYEYTYATKSAANEFEQKPVVTIESEKEPVPVVSTMDYTKSGIRINEIFPNPKGIDSGKEWIEVINTGTETISLHGWVVDDGDKESPIGSSAYKIQSSTLKPGEVAMIMIPTGSFAMNNTGSETIRLFAPDKKLIDSVIYNGVKEDLSYTLLNGKWQWGSPTPDEANSEAIETEGEGIIAGATLIRTGNDSDVYKADSFWSYFALVAIICYISSRLMLKGNTSNEQTRID